ncbi:MAG: Na+-transporting NADH:ubiquinone oxidoreductase, subunit NqrB [Cyanobacteria bacterium J083]|nr:MAG: Na+-transporting NADH:ubiquinone oxidoreductase, subunit NqrB [Cyanobacteria bacterium J083]
MAIFLLLGISTRDWTLRLDLMGVLVLTCLITQVVCKELSFLRDFLGKKIDYSEDLRKKYLFSCLSSCRSALITALGLCLLLRSNNYQTMMIAASLAIASKFIFRWQGKHFFNPANFGIIGALVFTADAWVSPGQWGTDWWYLMLFMGAGGLILQKVGRWDTSAVFLPLYAGLEAIRTYLLGGGWDIWQHQLMSGSLLLFTLFMLSDPRSIPNSQRGRIFWSVILAVLAFILQEYFYLSTAVFWTLFICSPLTLIIDKIWVAKQFNWQKQATKLSGVPY